MKEVKLRYGPEDGTHAVDDNAEIISVLSYNLLESKVYVHFYEITESLVWSETVGRYVQAAHFREDLTEEVEGWLRKP